MIAEVFNLYATRWDFFGELILQHLQLSFIAIGLSALIGIFFGIVISEHARLSFPILGITNFIYTIPSIAMLGFLVPATGIGLSLIHISMCIRDRIWKPRDRRENRSGAVCPRKQYSLPGNLSWYAGCGDRVCAQCPAACPRKFTRI